MVRYALALLVIVALGCVGCDRSEHSSSDGHDHGHSHGSGSASDADAGHEGDKDGSPEEHK